MDGLACTVKLLRLHNPQHEALFSRATLTDLAKLIVLQENIPILTGSVNALLRFSIHVQERHRNAR